MGRKSFPRKLRNNDSANFLYTTQVEKEYTYRIRTSCWKRGATGNLELLWKYCDSWTDRNRPSYEEWSLMKLPLAAE